MQPYAILAARDLCRIGAALDDAGDDDGVPRRARLGGDDDAVADAEASIGGEAAVYCDGAWAVLRVPTRDGAWAVLRVPTRDGAWAVLRVPTRDGAWAVLRRDCAEGGDEKEEGESEYHGSAG
jgi:hypothetical protein